MGAQIFGFAWMRIFFSSNFPGHSGVQKIPAERDKGTALDWASGGLGAHGQYVPAGLRYLGRLAAPLGVQLDKLPPEALSWVEFTILERLPDACSLRGRAEARGNLRSLHWPESWQGSRLIWREGGRSAFLFSHNPPALVYSPELSRKTFQETRYDGRQGVPVPRWAFWGQHAPEDSYMAQRALVLAWHL